MKLVDQFFSFISDATSFGFPPILFINREILFIIIIIRICNRRPSTHDNFFKGVKDIAFFGCFTTGFKLFFFLVIVLLKVFGIFGIVVHFRVSFVQFQSYSNHNPRSHILKFLFFVIWIVFNFGNLPFYK